jgi:hypothetical protein
MAKRVDSIRIPMRPIQRESRTANGNILGSVRPGRAVPDPLSPWGYYRLASGNVHRAASIFDSQGSLEYYRIFLEIRRLPGLDPATRAPHVRNANLCRFRVDAAYVLIN